MKKLIILLAAAMLLCGCLVSRSCQLRYKPDVTELRLGKTYIYLLPVPGAAVVVNRNLRLPPHQTECRGEEVQVSEGQTWTTSYLGTVKIDSDKKRVVVKLSKDGEPYSLNGKYRYYP